LWEMKPSRLHLPARGPDSGGGEGCHGTQRNPTNSQGDPILDTPRKKVSGCIKNRKLRRKSPKRILRDKEK